MASIRSAGSDRDSNRLEPNLSTCRVAHCSLYAVRNIGHLCLIFSITGPLNIYIFTARLHSSIPSEKLRFRTARITLVVYYTAKSSTYYFSQY